MRVPTLVDQSDAVRAEMDKISRTASTGAVDSSVAFLKLVYGSLS